jgi:glycosyltransferase involved in cell wall biosynthesis
MRMRHTEQVKKPVLCVASFFPPDATSGTHRTRAVVRYLPSYGWRPVVVTQRLATDTVQDPSLLEDLPEDLVVYRTAAPNLLAWATGARGWLRRAVGGRAPGRPGGAAATAPAPGPCGPPRRGWLDWASWWIQIPDMMIGWLPLGAAVAYRAARRHGCRAIYSTAPQWSTHLIALLIKRLTGLRWVADFRDPWRSSPWRTIPYASVDHYDGWLEGRVLREADWVVCNTGAARDDFARRFPGLAGKFIAVPNGFDPEDYADLQPRRPAGRDQLVLSHAGVFYGRRRPQPTFEALRLLRERGLAPAELCLQLLGCPEYEGRRLTAIAAEYGVQDLVTVRGEVPHRQALELMRGSDVQLLVGFNGTGAHLQVPAKLFEYFGVGRPVLALAPRQSAIAESLSSSGVDHEVCDPENPEDIAAALLRLAQRRHDAPRPGAAGDGPITQFYRREQVGRIAGLLAEAAPTRPSATPERR